MANEQQQISTRMKIMHAAFSEIHKNGFQGMRIDQVLKNTGLQKGALYHHFKGKQALGYAVLEELIEVRITELWITPLPNYDDPLLGITTLYENVGNTWSEEFLLLGCPLNNLAQEMSPIDEGFRERIKSFFTVWQQSISDALKNGQQSGIVDKNLNLEDCSLFILAIIESAYGVTKAHQNRELFFVCGRELSRYLNSLRAF